MKSSFLKVLAIIALIFNLIPASAALASHENEVKFTGAVESMPSGTFVGDWRIAGRTVHVTAATVINQEDGRITVGATVKVEGSGRADSSVNASEIELREGNSGGGNGGGSGSGGDDNSGGGSGSGNSGGNDDNSTKFKGTVQSFPNTSGFIGDWLIGGRTIHVTAATRIEIEIGPVAVGAFTEVKGPLRADGSMDATKVEIKSNASGNDGQDEIHGTIESLPSGTLIGDWRVSGRTVHVSSATRIDREHGTAAVGATVEVKGALRTDGSIEATSIEVKTSVDDSSGQSTNVKGRIESLPASANLIGDWTISGRTVHVISSTKLKAEHGAFAIGTRVKIKGMQMADGSVVATKIQVRD
jgi:hypothetical protein